MNCSYQKVQQVIINNLQQLPDELVSLKDAVTRITSGDVNAVVPQPSFDESLRDGYVVASTAVSDGRENRYTIIAEIPAGKPCQDILVPGTTCRIMTGGCVPKDGVRVIPYENCIEQNGEITVAYKYLHSAETFIRKTGSEVAVGELLVSNGEKLQAAHLPLLSSCGVHSVSVTAQPSVGFLCTGSELTAVPEKLIKGQKISSNSLLLEAFLTSLGSCPVDFGIIQDSMQDLLDFFIEVKTGGLDMVISTGGMGPGKYDLVEKAFVEGGGEIVFNSLDMRPGKSILYGVLGRTLFFGLPGPPNAVRTLLNILVGPTLLKMQGAKGNWPRKLQAYLHHQVQVKPRDVSRLKEGMLTLEDGKCSVRFAEKFDIPNCYIFLPAEKARWSAGELLEVYMVTSPSCSHLNL